MKYDKVIKEVGRMIENIYDLEEDFMENPTNERAMNLLAKWEKLIEFRKQNNIEEGMNRKEPLKKFLLAGNHFFKSTIEKKKKEALEELDVYRHED
ncbi:MAG: hypothetical protein AAB596_02750 [Patescibacteria group bacterium]